MSGSDIDSLDVHQLSSRIKDVEVFYRANPKHKLKIVKVLSQNTCFLQFAYFFSRNQGPFSTFSGSARTRLGGGDDW